MKLVWVTGARGFLGRHVARHFAAKGHKVAGIDRGHWAAEDRSGWGVGYWVESDVHLASLNELSTQSGLPQLVFHAAGGASVGPSFEDPLTDFNCSVTTTAEVLEFLRREAPSAIFILPSSAAVYGAQEPGPIPEDAPLRPVSPYGAHKLMAEQLCHSANLNFGLRCVLIRYFSLYGPELRKQLLWDLAAKLSGPSPSVELFGTGQETRDMFYIEDAVHLVSTMSSIDRTDNLVVNGGSGQATTVRDIASALIGRLGLSSELRFNGQCREGDPINYQAHMGRAQSLGYKPKWSLEEGLTEYVHWLNRLKLRSQG
jgi:UDP-glucose 4-epimerase